MYGAVKKERNLSESAGLSTFPNVGNSEFDRCKISSSVFTEIGLDLDYRQATERFSAK